MRKNNRLLQLMSRLAKPAKDFLLIFYDDLDFHAMSLPRIGAGVLTAVVITAWYADQFGGRRFEDFGALASLCGGVWAGYAFKKWTGSRGSNPIGDSDSHAYEDRDSERGDETGP